MFYPIYNLLQPKRGNLSGVLSVQKSAGAKNGCMQELKSTQVLPKSASCHSGQAALKAVWNCWHNVHMRRALAPRKQIGKEIQIDLAGRFRKLNPALDPKPSVFYFFLFSCLSCKAWDSGPCILKQSKHSKCMSTEIARVLMIDQQLSTSKPCIIGVLRVKQCINLSKSS